jgi:hypothetical protein
MAALERAEERHGLAYRLESRAQEYEEDAQLVMELMRRGLGGAASAMNKKRRLRDGGE